MGNRKEELSQTVDRAMRLLDAFPADRPDASLRELSRTTGIEPSTVHRLLSTLLKHGMVAQNRATRRYGLGPRLFELGSRVGPGLDLRRKALPVMQRLAEHTGETVQLFVYSAGEALCIEGAEAHGSPFRAVAQVGMRFPLHAGAAAKTLLAFRPADEVDRRLQAPLPRYTAHTITDPGRLRAELGAIQARGHAISHSERVVGLTAVSVPIRDHTGTVIAALSLDGPNARLTDERTQELIAIVTAAAQEISRELGHGKTMPADGSRLA